MNDNAPSTPPDRANDPARRPINSAPDTASQAPSASTEQTSLSWCNVGGHELSKDQKPYCFDPDCENFGKEIGSDDHPIDSPINAVACDYHLEIKCPHGVKNDRCEDCNSNICKHGTKKKSEFASDDDNRCVECIEEKPKKPYTPPAYIVAQRRRASGHRN